MLQSHGHNFFSIVWTLDAECFLNEKLFFTMFLWHELGVYLQVTSNTNNTMVPLQQMVATLDSIRRKQSSWAHQFGCHIEIKMMCGGSLQNYNSLDAEQILLCHLSLSISSMFLNQNHVGLGNFHPRNLSFFHFFGFLNGSYYNKSSIFIFA